MVVFPFRALIHKKKAVTAMDEWLDAAVICEGQFAREVRFSRMSRKSMIDSFARSRSIVERWRLWRWIHKSRSCIDPRYLVGFDYQFSATDPAGQAAEYEDFLRKYDRSHKYF